MASDWPLIKLGDFVEIQTGLPFKSKYFSESEGIKLLRGDNIVQGNFRWANVKRWPEDLLGTKEQAYLLNEGDVILAMDRPWIEAGLKTGQINKSDLPCLLVQRVARLRTKDVEDQDFLRYLISSYWFVQYVKLVQTGTAVPHISTKQIKDFEFHLPPKDVRMRIGKMIKSLDKKIHLNRQSNQILEQMAQALFKSWFVDFDPVIDNALAAGNDIPEALQQKAEQRKQAQQLPDFKPLPDNIRALFPSEFEQTDEPSIGSSGWIPKGWAHKELSEIIEYQKGFAFKSAWYQDEGHVVVRVSDTTYNSVDVNSCNKISKELADEYAAYALKEDDLVIATVGSWPPNYSSVVGKVIRVPRTAEGGLLNQNAVKLTVNDEFSFHQGYLYCCLKNSRFMEYIVNRAQGSANQASITLKSIFNFSALLASSEVMELFSNQIKQNFKQQNLNYEQIESLTRLRDTLLPKLISGELSLISE